MRGVVDLRPATSGGNITTNQPTNTATGTQKLNMPFQASGPEWNSGMKVAGISSSATQMFT